MRSSGGGRLPLAGIQQSWATFAEVHKVICLVPHNANPRPFGNMCIIRHVHQEFVQPVMLDPFMEHWNQRLQRGRFSAVQKNLCLQLVCVHVISNGPAYGALGI